MCGRSLSGPRARLCTTVHAPCGGRSADSNPAAATPQSMYNMYAKHAATTGNPYVLRTMKQTPCLNQSRRNSSFSFAPGPYVRVPPFEAPVATAAKPPPPLLGDAARHEASIPAQGGLLTRTTSHNASEPCTPADAFIRQATRGLFQH